MTNEEMYGVIFESLQNDINDEKITFEFGNILNDIAYEAFIEGTELSDEVSGILDRYLTEATADMEESPTEETPVEESADDDVINESVMNIITAYENAEITEDECKLLLESAGVDIDEVFTEAAGSVPVQQLKTELKRLLNALKAYAKTQPGSNIEPPSMEKLIASGKYTEKYLTTAEDYAEQVKAAVKDPVFATIAAGLTPKRFIETIPSTGMSKKDFEVAIKRLDALLNKTMGNIIRSINGTNTSNTMMARRTLENEKTKLLQGATAKPVEVEKRELSKQEANRENLTKQKVDRNIYNLRRRKGLSSQ